MKQDKLAVVRRVFPEAVPWSTASPGAPLARMGPLIIHGAESGSTIENAQYNFRGMFVRKFYWEQSHTPSARLLCYFAIMVNAVMYCMLPLDVDEMETMSVDGLQILNGDEGWYIGFEHWTLCGQEFTRPGPVSHCNSEVVQAV